MANIYIGCDHTVSVTGLRIAGGAHLNAATITYSLQSTDGTEITGGSGSLTYTPASDGDYTGTIESTVTALLTNKVLYLLILTIAESPYNDKRWIELNAARRGVS